MYLSYMYHLAVHVPFKPRFPPTTSKRTRNKMTPEIEFRITAKNTLRIIAVKSSKISKMNEIHKYVVENVKETRRSRVG